MRYLNVERQNLGYEPNAGLFDSAVAADDPFDGTDIGLQARADGIVILLAIGFTIILVVPISTQPVGNARHAQGDVFAQRDIDVRIETIAVKAAGLARNVRRERCCQSNANLSPANVAGAGGVNSQAARLLHSASAAERRSL